MTSSHEPQPLPLVDAGAETTARGRAGAVTLSEAGRERVETAFERLVTALSSCYVYVVGHTALEACAFQVERDGTGRCLLSGVPQWEVALPAAAHAQLAVVVQRWQEGVLPRSSQLDSIRLGEVRELPDGSRAVDVLPADDPRRRTRTTIG
ncbi:MAG TPA: hypothetical protein VKV26_00270 [Dehalococcoidia bacterium]|nr:hypothetical protein [Dehalococcoidia bacterium]